MNWLQKKLQKLLGITAEQQKTLPGRAYQAPIQNTYQPTLQRLPFEKTPSKATKRDMSKKRMKRHAAFLQNARELYEAAGGYEMFVQILSHSNWYKIQKDPRGEYTYTLRVINNHNRSKRGHAESKIMRTHTAEQAIAIKDELLAIHFIEMNRRNIQ